jgi:hypothetical protein
VFIFSVHHHAFDMNTSLLYRPCKGKAAVGLFVIFFSFIVLQAEAQPAQISPSVTAVYCSQNFSISLPSGASFQGWGQSFGSSSYMSMSTSGTTATVSWIADGDVQINCDYIYQGIGYHVTDNFHISKLPTEGPSIWGATQGQSFCQGATINLFSSSPTGSTTWSVSGTSVTPSITQDGAGDEAFLTLPTGYSGSDPVDSWLVTAQAFNACGVSSTQVTIAGYTDGCGDGGGTGTAVSRSAANGFGGIGVNSLTLYPNPAGDVVNIAVPDNFNIGGAVIVLTDLYGRKLKMLTTVGYSNRIYLSGLAAGVYFVQIIDGKKSVTMRKVIKN